MLLIGPKGFSKKKNEGSTLLDVVVGITILGISVAFIFQAFTSGHLSLVKATRRTWAVTAAMNKAQEIGVTERFTSGVIATPKFDSPLVWKVDLNNRPVLEISWMESGNEKKIQIQGLFVVMP